MDLTLSEEQEAVVQAASAVLEGTVDHASLKALEASGEPILHRHAWSELAKAGLLGIGLPEELGGAGLGLLEQALVLEQVGRAVAPVPYLTAVVGAAHTIASAGTEAQRARWVSAIIDGSALVTVALAAPGLLGPTTDPVVAAEPTGAGSFLLTGAVAFVPWAGQAARVLVPARTADDQVIFALVDPRAPGVSAEELLTTHRLPESALVLDGVVVKDEDVLGGGPGVLRSLVDRTLVGLCALQAGVCASAVERTAHYTAERHQFGVPIATFQAVAHRAADAFVDAHAVRLTMLQAAWRIDAGLDAREEIRIAAYWACEGAQRAVHAAQHLHGGIGVDLDYPLHRTFRWARALELTIGGMHTQLRDLGRIITATATGG